MRGLHDVVVAGFVFAACSMMALPAQAASGEWDHNDSVMKLVENGKKRRFVYEEPRQALKGAGVTTGTILFDGEEKQDGRLSGYAKLFRKGCDPIDYFVEGSFDRQKGEVLLQGQVPIYSAEGCKITGYSDDNKASKLRFVRLGGEGDRVAAIPGKEERPGYLPPASVTDAPPVEEREQTARIEREAPVEREFREPPRQRSTNRTQEDYFEPETREPYEAYEDDREYTDYEYRKRRAERDGRYAEEDAAYYARLEAEEDEEDDGEYNEDDDDYDDGAAYYSIRPRW